MALGLARDMAHPDQTLTLREMQVLNAMSDGLSTKVAARLLGVAVKTVESHKTRVFAKLGLHSQAQLVLKSARDSEAGRVSTTHFLTSSGFVTKYGLRALSLTHGEQGRDPRYRP
jgi:DNA-binding CsgD family transcriptional regulator